MRNLIADVLETELPWTREDLLGLADKILEAINKKQPPKKIESEGKKPKINELMVTDRKMYIIIKLNELIRDREQIWQAMNDMRKKEG